MRNDDNIKNDAPDVSLLLKQLRQDEQRLVRLRHNQNIEGSMGTIPLTTNAPFDFPLPGKKPIRQLPTPPQRRGGAGPVDHELGRCKVPIAPRMSEEQRSAVSKKKFFPPIPLPPCVQQAKPAAPATPTGAPMLAASDAPAEMEDEPCDTPRSVSSRASSRRSSRSSSRSMCGTPVDPERFDRLERMLVEERAGRLEMLDKVNALSRLIADQNKKIVENRRRNRYLKR